MTLEELLGKKGLGGMTVINKHADLTRPVATVESSETPDVAGYVPQHTLLLTTAMSYRSSQRELCGLIRGLNRLPAAGIAIKLGRFIDVLDDEVIKTADELGFPLLQIPMERTLGDVYHATLACLWDNENAELTYTLNMQKKFYNLILQGASLKKLLNNLSLVLKRPVLIVDIFGEVCGSSHTDRKQETVAAQTFRRLNLTDREHWQYRHLEDAKSRTAFFIYPIRAENSNTHYLVVFEPQGGEKPPSAEGSQPRFQAEVNLYATQQILLIFGMHFYKNLYLTYNGMQVRENFLKILVDEHENEAVSPKHLLAMGKDLSFRSCSCYRVVAAAIKGMGSKTFQSAQLMRREERYILIYGWIRKKLESPDSGDILVLPDTGAWRYILLLQEHGKNLDKRLGEIHERIKKVFHEELIFSYGSNAFEIKEIGTSYRRAAEGLREVPEGSFIHAYRVKNIMELIQSISKSQIEEVCENVLKSLARPEDEMTQELKKTLRVYLDCHCSIMETANRLFLHRNTVRYRIKKCEEILDHELSDPEYCFQLQFSLMLSEL